MSNVITYFLLGCRQKTGLTCGSPHDPKSLEICDRIREILSLEMVCLKVHMSDVRLAVTWVWERGSLLLITQVHIKLPKLEQ
jgi:hypothetical protein